MTVDPGTWKEEGGFLPRECTPFEPDGDLQKALNLRAIQYARALDLPLLLTLDSHMVSAETKFIQDILLQNGNPNGWRYSETYYMMNAPLAWAAWCQMGLEEYSREFVEAVESNQRLVDMVEDNINLPNRVHLPPVVVPEHIYRELAGQDEVEQHLAMVDELIEHHGRMPDDPVYRQRLQDEIQIIARNGTINFTPYFIFLEKVCREARENGDLVGPGRGSAAGCLLSYLLGITHLDPIRWGLPFSRFLSMGRIARHKYPDVDLDFGNPGAVAERLKAQLGDNFARVCTVGTMKVRSAIRDVCRVLLGTKEDGEMSEEVDQLCKSIALMPQGADTKKWFLGYQDKEGVVHQGELQRNEALAEFFEDHPDVEKGVLGVLDVPRAIGRHAAGYCVADVPVREVVPICRVKEEECTQYTKDPVEKLGLLKVDLLGVNTLNDIGGAIKWVKYLRDIDIDFYNVPLDCPNTWAAFRRAENQTVFQFNSPLGRDLSLQIQPSSVEDLAQMTAAGRPGTLDALMPDGETKLITQWIEVRRGTKQPSFIHDSLANILGPTAGICIFQEQISAMFQQACGYTEEEADEIREIVGKKKQEQMAEKLPDIRRRLSQAGWNTAQIDSFISLCVAASNYSFNRSHSVCYAYLGYVCQWLKTNYPLEWWTSILQNSSLEDIKKNSAYCSHLVSPPNVNRSELNFFIAEANESESGGRIIYPLKMIKQVKGAAEWIYQEKPFSSFEDFYQRINRTRVNQTVVTQLIWAGAFDELCGVSQITDRNFIYESYMELRGGLDRDQYVPKDRLELMNLQADALPMWVPDYVSFLRQEFPSMDIRSPSVIRTRGVGMRVLLGGRIASRRNHVTKKGQPMCFLTLINGPDETSITCFPDLYEGGAKKIEEGMIVWVGGKVNNYNGRIGVVADEIFQYKRDPDVGEAQSESSNLCQETE